MTHSLRTTTRFLCRIAEAVAIIALIAATALIMVQIVARELFMAGLSWADELARYAGLTIVFMAIPALLARDEHVKVDMFLNMMPDPVRRRVSIANDLLVVLFCATFIAAGWLFLQRAARFSTPALGMPNLIWYGPAIIGTLLMLLVAIERSIAALTGRGNDEAAP